jgi:hypothetical protein
MVNPPAPFTHWKGMLSYHTLLLFRYADHDLDKSTLVYFGPVTPLCPDMAVPCFKDTYRNPSEFFHDP